MIGRHVCQSGLVLALAAGVSQAGSTVVDWLFASDGMWSDPARWSGGVVPNNAGPDEFIARIVTPGSYTVSLDVDVVLSGFEFVSTGADLEFDSPGRSFTSTGNNTLSGAAINGAPGSSFVASGNNLLNNGGSFANLSTLSFVGTTNFDGGDDWDICDTCVDLVGASGWNGTGGFNLDNVSTQSELVVTLGSTLTASGAGSRSITSSSNDNKLINRGTLVIDLDDATDTVSVVGAGFVNEAGGSVEVKKGTLFANALGVLNGGVLSGGKWRVMDGGTVDLGAASISTLQAEVELSGPGSSFAALGTLGAIGASGELAVTGGRVFELTGGLTLDGALTVGMDSVVDVDGDIDAFAGGSLTKGTLRLGGTLVGRNTLLEVVDGDIRVGPGGALLVRDAGGKTSDGVALTRIGSAGLFGVVEGRELDLTATDNTVTVEGTLLVGASLAEGGMGRGSELLADAVTIEVGSTLEIGIASATDFGSITVDVLSFGAGAAGDTAGTLSLVLDDGYSAALGDEFLIADLASAGSLFGTGFAALDVNRALGGGLFFEQFTDVDGLGVRVVPAPASLGLLAGGLLACRRRRG